MKLIFIFLFSTINITLIYLGQYLPFIIGLLLFATLFFYSKKTNVKNNFLNEESIKNQNQEKKKELIIFLSVFENDPHLYKHFNNWATFQKKYNKALVNEALQLKKIERLHYIKQTNTKSVDQYNLILELIKLRKKHNIYMDKKISDPIIQTINHLTVDKTLKHKLRLKAQQELFKINENVKNEETNEQKTYVSLDSKNLLMMFGFENFEHVDKQKLKKEYKKMLSKYHPDKHQNLSTTEKKKMEEKFSLIQHSYEKLLKEINSCS